MAKLFQYPEFNIWKTQLLSMKQCNYYLMNNRVFNFNTF